MSTNVSSSARIDLRILNNTAADETSKIQNEGKPENENTSPPDMMPLPACYTDPRPNRKPILNVTSKEISMLPRTLFTAIVLAASIAAAPAQHVPKIEFEKFTLPNGLQVILHVDRKLPMVHVNSWYHVGSKVNARLHRIRGTSSST